MANIVGYEEQGAGLAVILFDDGSRSEPVVMDDNLIAEVEGVAKAVNESMAVPENIVNTSDNLSNAERVSGAMMSPAPARQGTTVIDNTMRAPGDPGPLAAAPPVPAPAAPALAPAGTTEAVSDPYAGEQRTFNAPGSTSTSLPAAQEQRESALGDDATGVRMSLLEAAAYKEQAALEQAAVKSEMAEKKGRLIGDRLAQLDVEREAQVAEEARAKVAIDEANKRMKLVSQKQLDPTQAFGNEPAWFKILTLIGMAAGAASKGKNHTLEAVNGVIDQSLRLQQETKSSELARLTRILGSEEAALAASRMQMRQAVERRLELGILQADNEAEAAWFRSNFAAARAARLTEEAQAQAATATSIRQVGAAAKPMGVAASAAWNPETQEEKALLAANDVSDAQMTAYAKERQALNVDSILNSVNQAERVITQLSKGQDVPGLGGWDSFATAWMNDPDGAAVQQVLGMTKAQFMKAISGAAISEPEAKRLEGILQGPGRPTLDTVRRGLSLLRADANAKMKTLDDGNPRTARVYNEIGTIRRDRALSQEQRNQAAKKAKEQSAAEQRKLEAERKRNERASHSSARDSDRAEYENSVDDEPDPFEVNQVPKWKK